MVLIPTYAAHTRLRWVGAVGPGLAVAIPAAIVGMVVGDRVPVVGAPVVALLLGVAAGQVLRRRSSQLAPGLALSSATLLQIAVVLIGAQISLGEMASVGVGSLPVMLLTLSACLAVAVVVGRALGVDSELRTLVGVGTAICGASAIAAVSSVTRPRSASIAYAISTIFCFNVVAVLVFPPLGHLLHLGQEEFGLFAGTAVNDTSSVVAASTSYGDQAAGQAVIVKLTRTLMIVPICAVLAARSGSPDLGRARRMVRLVPWFLVGFVAMAALNSLGAITSSEAAALKQTAAVLTATAMAAIGCSTDLAAVRRAGARPLLLGALLWFTVTVTSLLAQALL